MENLSTKDQKVLLQWTAGGEKKDSSSIAWMVVLFLLTGASLVYNLFLGKWIVGAVFVLLLVILIWYFFSSSKTVLIALTDKGVQLNNQFYSFENIKGYWYSDRTNTFYLEPKKRTSIMISFPLGAKRIEDIKKNLPDYLVEIEGRGEDVIDRITGMLHM